MNNIIFNSDCFELPEAEEEVIIFFENKSKFSDLNHFAWECAKEEFKLKKEFISEKHTWEERKKLYCGFEKVKEEELIKDLDVLNSLKYAKVFKIPSEILSVVKCIYSDWDYFFYAFETKDELYSIIWSTTA